MRAMPANSYDTRAAAKPWWRSRTIWFNLILGALAVADVALGLLQTMLPFNASPWLALALVLGNMALRAVTNMALGSKAGDFDVQ